MKKMFPHLTPRTFLALLLTVSLLAVTGCSTAAQTDATPEPEQSHPVSVLEIKEQSLPVELTYTGTLGTGEIRKLSFKVPGKLAKVYVHKGDHVTSGQKLAELNKTDLNYALEAAQITVQKAGLAYNEAKTGYTRLEQLAAAGGLAQSDLDKAKLDLDVKEATYRQAQIDAQAKESALKDTDLYSNMDGYVVDVLNHEGEVAAAGYPVVVLRQGQQLVNVGLSQEDVKKVKQGTAAAVSIESLKAAGKIKTIDPVPDAQSRTYNAEIALSEELPAQAYQIGATVKVAFAIGEKQGIWIPISSVLNDGEDYVFVVDNGRALKKNIRLLDHQGFNVRVEGLKPGDVLVTSGMKELKEGSPVNVKTLPDAPASDSSGNSSNSADPSEVSVND